MYQVVVVNESSGKSLKSSQRVLAKYLPQIGQFSYAGTLSEEGIDELESQLKAVRSKNTSVICYHLKNDHVRPILFLVGNKNSFDTEQGLYAFRTKALKKMPSYTNLTLIHSLQIKLSQLSALWHDLGKSNEAFQSYLKNILFPSDFQGSPQFLRHDAVGFLILHEACSIKGSLKKALSQESISFAISAIRNKCKDIQLLRAHFCHAYTTLIEALVGKNNNLSSFFDSIFLFMVLTHHRLPYSSNFDESTSYQTSLQEGYSTFFNENFQNNWEQCISFPNISWISYIQDRQKTMLDEIEQLQNEVVLKSPLQHEESLIQFKFEFLSIAFNYFRPFLISSDHIGSALKSDTKWTNIENSKSVVMANIGKRYNSKAKKIEQIPGDSLKSHLLTVGSVNRRILALSSSCLTGEDLNMFDYVEGYELKKLSSMLLNRSGPASFAWQDYAYDKISEECKNSHSFVCISAATGSGKTIASAKIMRALSNKIRYTYCLGLRSLTLQTGRSYQEDVGFKEDQLAIVIGDLLVKKQFENQSTVETPNFSENYFESEFAAVEQGRDKGGWLEYIKQKHSIEQINEAISPKTAKIISTPVVVCTVDQIVDSINHGRFNQPIINLRLISSDIIFDEIDNYSSEEMRHIARLIFQVGLAGRNVVIMSATVSSEIVSSLFNHYQAGLFFHQKMLPESMHKSLKLVQVSNLIDCEINAFSSSEIRNFSVTNPTSKLAFKSIQNYNEKICNCLSTKISKAYVRSLPITKLNAFEAILSEAITLHESNSYRLNPLNQEQSTSIGFVRFNTVKSARAFSKYLLERNMTNSEAGISVLCYHSKYSNFELGFIEKNIATLTNRKKAVSPELPVSTEGLEILTQIGNRYSEKKKIILIIVTTSIMEVGRDFDFDWAILEPQSLKSLIQSAGRVYRHRFVDHKKINIALMSNTFKELNFEKNYNQTVCEVYSQPGTFTRLNRVFRNSSQNSSYYLSNVSKIASSVKSTYDVSFDEPLLKLSASPPLSSDFLLNLRETDREVSAAYVLMPYSKVVSSARLWDFFDYFFSLEYRFETSSASAYRMSSADIYQAGKFLTQVPFKQPFRGIGLKKSNAFSILKLDAVLSDNIPVENLKLSHSLQEGYSDATSCITEIVNIKDLRQSYLTVSVSPNSTIHQQNLVSFLRSIQQKELLKYVKSGWTKLQLLEICSYTIDVYGNKDIPCYNAFLGYNNVLVNDH